MKRNTIIRLAVAVLVVVVLVVTLLFTFRVVSSYHVTKSPGTERAMATALCNDGIYSYSLSRGGTCARHDGVKEWLIK